MIESFSALNQHKILGHLKTDIIIYNLTNTSNSIGRSPESNIVLNHPSISKEHAKINFSDNDAYLVDLNSENGTFLNRQKINPLQNKIIQNNDIINFGKDTTDYIFQMNFDNNEPNYKIVRYPKNDISERDNKISLVNDNNYQHSKINHLNNPSEQAYKLNSFNPFINNMSNEFNRDNDDIKEDIQINNNPIIEEEEEITMKDSKQFVSNNNNLNLNYNKMNDNNVNKEFNNPLNIDNNNDNNNDNDNNNLMKNNNNLNNNNINDTIKNPFNFANTLINNLNKKNNNMNTNNNINYEVFNKNNNFPNSNNLNNNLNNQIINVDNNTIREEKNNIMNIPPIINNNISPNNSLPKNNHSSLYKEIYEKNSSLEKKLKEKRNELQNLSSLYEQLNDKYNKLNARHNALMIYASDIQKKNDILELNYKEAKTQILNYDSQDITKIIKEKEKMISHLQEENNIYKNELSKIKNSLINPNNPKINDNLTVLMNDYLRQITKYKQIIAKYIAYETECSKKWNELILSNETLNNKCNELKRNWDEDIKKFNNIIKSLDIRLQSSLSNISKGFGPFNIQKEEAAKYLVEQMSIYIQEKSNLMKENNILNKNITELKLENEQLKSEIVKKELNDNNHDVKVLREKIDELQDIIKQKDQIYDPEKMIDYENLILRLNLQIKQKDELIEEYKSKIDNYMKNTNVLNFDDKEIVGAVSNVLKEKDQVIQNLKNKIIDYSSGNFTVNLGNNKV